ncbi:MAG: primosomal protein N' [bacterium]
MKYIKVVLNLPLNRSFSYRVPADLEARVKIGGRVLVPFTKRNLTGFVVGETKEKEAKANLREILKVIDDLPPLRDSLLKLGRWISEYYYCSLGQALHSVLPLGKAPKIPKPEGNGKGFFRGKGFGKFKFIEYQPHKTFAFLEGKGAFLFKAAGDGGRKSFYLPLLQQVLQKGKQVILIVPEINYIPFLKNLIQPGYPQEIAVIHSRLSPKERYSQWRKMEEGKIDLAMGTRSAVFAPLPKLGLITIEEEENTAYKQMEVPRYHVREVAIRRGEREGFPVVLFSQSPSLESFYRAQVGIYRPIKTSSHKSCFPQVEIVDLRKEENTVFSFALRREIEKCLAEKKSSLLFLNRRGFANFILCLECGEMLLCPNCNIGLTFHLKNSLICHYCNYQKRVPRVCPSCGGSYLHRMGMGTEQLEMEAREVFPRGHIKRADLDTANSPLWYQGLLAQLRTGKVNLLVGTQLIIKEEILKTMSLVGIILTDHLLNLPDFRASEQVFQLLWKIKRFLPPHAKIIIQTYNPTHYTIASLKNKEENFYRKELMIREELGYPPYLHWVRILFEGRVKGRVEEIAETTGQRLRGENLGILGPSPCPFGRIKGKYRYHLVLKDKDLSKITKILEKKLDRSVIRIHGVKMTVDVDPLETM